MLIDQKLKERLVGMGVLIFLGIIVIPWVLDGERPVAEDSQEIALNLPEPTRLKTHDINLQQGTIKVVPMTAPDRSALSLQTDADAPPRRMTSDTEKKGSQKSVVSKPDLLGEKNAEIEQKAQNDKVEQQKITESQDRKLEPRTVELAKTQQASASVKVTETSRTTSELVKVNAAKESSRNKLNDTQAEIKKVESDPLFAWAVQVGSFSDKSNAEKQVSNLKEKGYPAFLYRFQTDSGKVLYRVRVGPEKDRTRADKLLAKVNASGFKGKVLAHP